jgi:hypothetical protein
MNIIDLLEIQIKSQGKDGLANCRLECGCKLGDLAPCGEISDDCELAEFDFETAETQGLDFFMRACPPNTNDNRTPGKDSV